MKVELSNDAQKLLKLRYCKPDEEAEDVYPRVANALGGHDGYEKEFLEIMASRRFLPNSPALMNAGLSNALKACFVLPIHDSMESIFKTLKDAAMTFQAGGGCGYSFSELRQRGASLSNGGSSSGVLSFMAIYDAITEAVKQGSRRRGASMGVLDVDHPEIFDFIKAKLTPGTLSNFNLSVMVNNEFMDKIETDEYQYLHDVQDRRRTVGKFKAHDLFNIICFSAYLTGDPGLMFYDRINRDNPFKEKIKSSNPCLSSDTMISTTQGQISIGELSKTRSRCADVYSMNKKGRLIITQACDIRCTQKNKQPLLEIDFRRGKIRCTTDHKLYVIGKGWVRADELEIGNHINGLLKSRRGAQYIGIRLSSEAIEDERMEHRFVIEYYVGKLKKEMDVHHINANSHDNRIENLQVLPHGIHSKIEKKGNDYYNLVNGKFTSKDNKKKKNLRNLSPKATTANFSIKSICEVNPEMVYDMNVPKTNNYIANGIVVHNCGEVCMFPYESCIAEGTLVRTSKGIRLIENVSTGDKVLSFSEKDSTPMYSEVIKNIPHGKQETIHFVLENGMEISTTYDHLILTIHGWKRADHLDLSDFVAIAEFDIEEALEPPMNFKLIAYITCSHNRNVYDLALTPIHNFVANGIVVHNCCLGSINLNEHIIDNDVDWSKFKETAEIGTQMLLSINKYSEYPVDECYKQNYKMNRIGLGLMGFADALMKMHIKYDSDETLELVDKITGCMFDVAKKKAPTSASVLSIAPTGCKDRDTEVLTNEGIIKIQDLFEKPPTHRGWYAPKNIRVRSMDFWRVPDSCYYGGMMDGYEFEYANGTTARLSCEDKMCLQDPYSEKFRWITALDVIVGDKVLFESFYGQDGTYDKSKPCTANREIYYSEIIRKTPSSIEAFDLSIPEEHAFFLANGLYTHNSLSILASCSPSIEPIFSESYTRNLTFGTVDEVREKNEYLRTAHEVSPMWHLKIQAQFQKTIDNAVSKCLRKGTKILTTNGLMPIETFHTGKESGFEKTNEEIYVFDQNLIKQRILHGYYDGIGEIICIRTEDGFELEGSQNHKILTRNGWKSLSELSLMDYVKRYTQICEPEYKKISLIRSNGLDHLYDIAITGDHIYLVNGFVTHNTVNLPHDTTIQDIYDVYYNAWKMGCKGVTVFRDGSKGDQVMISNPTSKCDGETCYL